MPLHAFQAAARRFAFALSFSLRCPSTMARTSPIVTVWMQIDRPSFHCDGTAHRSSSVCGWSLIVSLYRGLAHPAGDRQSLRERALARILLWVCVGCLCWLLANVQHSGRDQLGRSWWWDKVCTGRKI